MYRESEFVPHKINALHFALTFTSLLFGLKSCRLRATFMCHSNREKQQSYHHSRINNIARRMYTSTILHRHATNHIYSRCLPYENTSKFSCERERKKKKYLPCSRDGTKRTNINCFGVKLTQNGFLLLLPMKFYAGTNRNKHSVGSTLWQAMSKRHKYCMHTEKEKKNE